MRCYIFMGDVTGSRKLSSAKVQASLETLTARANERFASLLLSPLTVTLGDEFQGVADSADTLVRLAFWFQEQILADRLSIQMHYSMVEGEIDTPINHDIAHGMLGEGLSRAREMLVRKDRSRPRYQIDLEDAERTAVIRQLFAIMEDLEDRWNGKDFDYILALLSHESDAEVAEMFGKDRSQVYKRRRTLLTDSYARARSVIRQVIALD
ncbi:MAG: SatD family protein [Henriciella sp.]|uniref:SatD family protein n=1 Tax=Henriciella sp. TaxID=1968823 RepID=UPI002616DBC7|nr:SatD family protein [Henriciella sp.]